MQQIINVAYLKHLRMPQRKGKGKRSGAGGGRMVNVSGPGGFRLAFPIPRLPSWLGAADRLSANASVYPRVDLDMPIVVGSQVVTAGALAGVISVDVNALIPNWSSRFSNTFREYCVVGIRLELTLITTSSPAGLVLVFVDETLGTAPNAGSAFTPHLEVPIVNNPDGKTQLLSYKPSGSYTDLGWTPTVSPVTRQWIKFYASNATTLTGAATAASIVTRGTIALAFRGYTNF